MVDDIRQQLRAVQESYRTSLPDKLARLEVLWHLLQAENELQASYEEFYRLLHTIHEAGKTILFTSHRPEEIKSLATRIMVLHKGSLVFDGSPQKYFQSEVHENLYA